MDLIRFGPGRIFNKNNGTSGRWKKSKDVVQSTFDYLQQIGVSIDQEF
eukprot:UN05473